MAIAFCLIPMIAPKVGAATSGGADFESADAPDRYTLFLSDAAVYDDNVFRLPSYQANLSGLLAPNASRQDHIDVLSVGTDDVFEFSRQIINFEIQVSENYFIKNKFLDNASGAGELNWKWEFGTELSGDAGIDYSRELANSAQTLFYGKDLVSGTNKFADARYELSSRWVIEGGIRAIDTTNSAVQVRLNNFHSQSGNAGLEFDSTATSSLGIEYRFTDGRALQNFGDVGPDGKNYHEYSDKLSWKYALDDKSEFDGNAGYLKRYYPDTPLGAFSGDVWRINFNWRPTDKSSVSVAAWRDLEAYFDAESNYFVARGESIAPSWAASDKLNFIASVSWVTEDYIASNPGAYTLGARQDRVASQQINISYVPEPFLSISLAYTNESHSSTFAFFKYEDRILTGTIKFTF